MKIKQREKAIQLRKQGYSYSEILEHVHVSKSTLSLWLRSVGLSSKQKHRLTEKKWISMKKGWEKRRKLRIDTTKLIETKAYKEIEEIEKNNHYLWFMGAMLYWAEGSKSKNYRPSQGILFSNSDQKMIKFFLLWLNKVLKVSKNRITFQIYIHETKKMETLKIRKFWSIATGFSVNKFDKIYYKKNKVNSHRKNTGSNYYGLVRIQVKKSTNLNRKITGWIEGICNAWEIV